MKLFYSKTLEFSEFCNDAINAIMVIDAVEIFTIWNLFFLQSLVSINHNRQYLLKKNVSQSLWIFKSNNLINVMLWLLGFTSIVSLQLENLPLGSDLIEWRKSQWKSPLNHRKHRMYRICPILTLASIGIRLVFEAFFDS